MSDTVNPYESPENASIPEERFIMQGGLTEMMLIYLKGTAPWLRFLGILGFVSAASMALSGVGSIIVFLSFGNIVDYELFPGFTQMMFGGQIAVFFLMASVLTFIPSLFAYRYGSRIHHYLKSGVNADLEAAFKNNKALWKFLGISCIVSLAFIPLSIIITIITVLLW